MTKTEIASGLLCAGLLVIVAAWVGTVIYRGVVWMMGGGW